MYFFTVLVVLVPFLLYLLKRIVKVLQRQNINWENYREKYERPLDIDERFFSPTEDFFSPMTTCMGVTSRQPVTEEIINECLKRMFREHTCFRLLVKRNAGGDLYFTKMKDEAVNYIEAEVRSDKEWEKVAGENSTNRILDYESGPTWKCIFLPNAKMENPHEELFENNCVLIIVQTHLTNDGVGCVNVFKTLLRYLNDSFNDDKKCDINNIPFSPPTLPCDYYHQKKYPKAIWRKLVETFVAVVIDLLYPLVVHIRGKDNQKQNAFTRYVGLESDKKPGCKQGSRGKLCVYSKQEVLELVQACRRNGCTVQGAVIVAAQAAFLSILHDHGAKEIANIYTGVPFDLRRQVSKNLDGVLELLSGSIFVTCKNTGNISKKKLPDLWELAKNSTKTVHSRIKNYCRPLVNFIGMQIPELFPTRTGPRIFLIASSLGRFEFCNTTDTLVKPSGYCFSLAAKSKGPIFETYVTTINGIMYITHTYFPHVTSDKISQEYIQKFSQVLQSFIEDGKI